MRTLLFALALLVAAPTVAATPSDAPAATPSAAAVASSFASVSTAAVRPAARIVVRTPMVVAASFTLRAGDGRWVRSYRDRLLWDGETTLNLNVDDIPAGTYQLVVKTRIGTQTIPIVIS